MVNISHLSLMKEGLGIPRRLPFCTNSVYLTHNVAQKGDLDTTRTLERILSTMKILSLILTIIAFAMQTHHLLADVTITPEYIRSLPAFPADIILEHKRYENDDLALGKTNTTSLSEDDDIAYGITEDEVEDAENKGFLPKHSKLPKKMTKKQADWWYENITIPTYRAIVREIVKVPLTIQQEASLVFFVQNTGRGNLKKLVSGENRLNQGNYQSVVSIMPLYYKAKDKKKTKGLLRRGNFQLAVYKGESFIPKA